jgi:hypothetical protein
MYGLVLMSIDSPLCSGPGRTPLRTSSCTGSYSWVLTLPFVQALVGHHWGPPHVQAQPHEYWLSPLFRLWWDTTEDLLMYRLVLMSIDSPLCSGPGGTPLRTSSCMDWYWWVRSLILLFTLEVKSYVANSYCIYMLILKFTFIKIYILAELFFEMKAKPGENLDAWCEKNALIQAKKGQKSLQMRKWSELILYGSISWKLWPMETV